MTEMSREDDRIERVVAAALQLRIPVSPHVDPWPAILARLGSQHRTKRLRVPWITIVVVFLLLSIGSSILLSRIASYRQARSLAAVVTDEVARQRIARAREISSDHDRAAMLIGLVKTASADTVLASLVIQVAQPIESPHDKSDVLVELANARAVTTPSLRESYLSLVNTISSRAERERALDALER